jgi:nitrite reductase/ring-hydroxylating ferredoxin subunit
MATKTSNAVRHVVAPVAEFGVGETRIVDVKGRSIGVINDHGRYYALRNVCPHHGAPLCQGRVQGFMRPSEPHVYDYSGDEEADRVVLCPWHGYKFRLADGRSVTEPETSSVRTYEVAVEDEHVVVYV